MAMPAAVKEKVLNQTQIALGEVFSSFGVQDRLYVYEEARDRRIIDVITGEQDPLLSIAAMHPFILATFMQVSVDQAQEMREVAKERRRKIYGSDVPLASTIHLDDFFNDPAFVRIDEKYTKLPLVNWFTDSQLKMKLTSVYFDWQQDGVGFGSRDAVVSIAFTPAEALAQTFSLGVEEAQEMREAAYGMLNEIVLDE